MERITNAGKLSKKTLGINQYITQLTTSCVACNLGKRDTLLEDRQLKKEMIYNETELRKAFHPDNHQWLPAERNLSKIKFDMQLSKKVLK